RSCASRRGYFRCGVAHEPEKLQTFRTRSCANRKRTPMDMPRSEVRDLRFDQFSVTKHLEHASAQARARNYQDFLIVDVDSHHYENESYKDLFQYIDNPVLRRPALEPIKRTRVTPCLNSQFGYLVTGVR